MLTFSLLVDCLIFKGSFFALTDRVGVSLAIVSVFWAPQAEQRNVRIPAARAVGCFVTVPLFQVCPEAQGFTVSEERSDTDICTLCSMDHSEQLAQMT